MTFALKDVSIHQLVELQALKQPDAIAAIFQNQHLTYRELNERANQLAHFLKKGGVLPEAFVGICVDRSLWMIIALLGVLKAGCTYVPLDPSYPRDRLELVIEDAQLSRVVTQAHLVNQLPQFASQQIICLDTDSAIAQESIDNPESKLVEDPLAYVIYTSGSTGKPKGVQVTHRGVVNFLASMQQEPGLTCEDVVLAITTIAFDIAVLELFLPLSVGAQVVIASREVTIDGKQLAQLLEESRATLMQATPATWRLLLNAGWQGQSGLKMLCGGEAMTRSLANQLLDKGQSLWNLYGPTETTIWSAIYKVEHGTEAVPIGYPIANTQIYIIDEQSRRKGDLIRLVAQGEAGELCIGGAGVARGYFNRPDLTEERFVQNPFGDQPEERIYRTGDLARFRPDGTIEFIGRIDHQVKIRGFRIELGDIEAAISQHPAIDAAAVTTKEDASNNKRLVAYVIPNEKDDLIESSFVTDARQQQILQWQNIWNTTYQQPLPSNDTTFNTNGWNSSYTGILAGSDEMNEWLHHSVERVLALRPQRLLEIGCGTGMLLFRLAHHCTHYQGIDVSAAAIHYIQQQIAMQPGDWSHVTLLHHAAHEIQQFEPATFDTIVLNSVVQYFPDIEYLVNVIQSALKLVKPGGQIFIGDVRSLPLLQAFHTSVQLSQAPDSLTATQLQERIQTQIAQERELVIHPEFFLALKEQFPQITHVQTELKPGWHQNEFVRFRYDVTLHVDTPVCAVEQLALDWQQDNLTLAGVRQQLHKSLMQQNNHKPKGVKITGIPNRRVVAELQLIQSLVSSSCPATVEALKELAESMTVDSQAQSIDPADLFSLAQALDLSVNLTWSEVEDHFDAQFYQRFPGEVAEKIMLDLAPQAIAIKPWRFYANNPLKAASKSQLIPSLRAFLQEKLPSYMVPSIFVVVDAMPLTPNGKIDRRALPEPEKTRPEGCAPFVAARTPAQQQMAEIWSQVLELDQVGIQDNFFELGGHSLLAVQLLAQVQTVFQVDVPLLYLFKNPTIEGLLSAIDRIQQAEGTEIEQEHPKELQTDAILDPAIAPQHSYTPHSSDGVLLTGATGFLGAFLLQSLLQQSSSNIYCLVRASSFEEAKQRIQTNQQRYRLWNEEFSSRIIPIVGTLSEPCFGLTDLEFSALARQIDIIYHNGALTNLVYPYLALRESNVVGTQEVLRLASQGKVKPVHFISTLDVFQAPSYFNQTIILEDDSLAHGDELIGGYAQTKWVAEKLVKTAIARGIPASIYRPSMIAGHSETGVFQSNDLLGRLIKGLIQMGKAPIMDRMLGIVPVDYVSQAIVHLSRQPNCLGKAFHLANPTPMSFVQVIHYLQSLGYQIEELSHDRWQAELRNLSASQDNAMNPFAHLFTTQFIQNQTYLETSLLSDQIFDCQNTIRGLRGTSIICPPITQNLLKLYFEHFIRSEFLPSPSLAVNSESLTQPSVQPWQQSARLEGNSIESDASFRPSSALEGYQPQA